MHFYKVMYQGFYRGVHVQLNKPDMVNAPEGLNNYLEEGIALL